MARKILIRYILKLSLCILLFTGLFPTPHTSAQIAGAHDTFHASDVHSYFTSTDAGRAAYMAALQRRLKRGTWISANSDFARVQEILSDLSTRLSLDFTPTILLLDTRQWNAYALPGNIIIVTTAIASDLDDTALRILLLHELGHIMLDHPRVALDRSKDAKKALDKSAAHAAANQPDAAADAFVAAIYKGRVERADEIAADTWAAAHLQAAGLTVDEAVAYLRHAQRKLGDPFRSPLHPSFDERVRIYTEHHGG